MNAPVIECVPNFSDGRRPHVLEAIVSAIQRAAPVSVLDRSSDHDHNRSVVTFVGAPEDVLEAAFAAIQTAAGLIDMEVHRGQHPRIGATDVVPFVPLRGATLEQCAELARDSVSASARSWASPSTCTRRLRRALIGKI